MRGSIAATLAVSLISSCSDTTPTAQGSASAHFVLSAGAAPAFLEVPYPNTVQGPAPAGIEIVAPANANRVVRELAQLDGASRFTMALFRVDEPSDEGAMEATALDPGSLPRTEDACRSWSSAVFLVDLEEKDPARALIPCRAGAKDDRAWGSSTLPLLAVGPARGVVLEEGHEYAAVLTSRARTVRGRAVEASADFRAIRDGARADAAAVDIRGAVDRAAAVLGGAVRRDEIVSIAHFRTHTRARELFALRAALDAQPAPVLRWDDQAMAPMVPARFASGEGGLPAGFTATLDAWLGVVAAEHRLPDGSDDWDNTLPVRGHNRVAAFGSAVLEAPTFLRDLGSYEVPDHATIARLPDGTLDLTPTRSEKIWVSIAVPRTPMPPGGYPTVIVQHGMGGSRTYFLDIMNALAREGWLGVAVDSITFGARAVDRSKVADVTTDYVGKPGATYAGPDGLGDRLEGTIGPVDLFGNVVNLGALRDQMRQAALDTATLVRALRASPDLSPLATGSTVPRIDPERIVYLGESLGSVQGEIAAAIVPEVKSWVFVVGGGGILLEAGTHGPGIASLLAVGGGLTFGLPKDRFDEYHSLVNLSQTAIEPCDPILLAPYLVKTPRIGAPRNVLQIEVLNDELLSNEGNESFARAAGLRLATPNVGSNAGATSLPLRPRRDGMVPFVEAAPDATGAIHDVPFAGVTAVLMQAGPADHGADIVASKGVVEYGIPLFRPSEPLQFRRLAKPVTIRNPYRELVGSVVRFFRDGFEGKTPGVVVLAPARRDFDDDGVPDDQDADPSDPTVR